MLLLVGVACVLLANSITSAQNTPALCAQSNSMNFNATQVNGTWWEVARNPSSGLNCVKVNIIAEPNDVLKIETRYAQSPNYLWVNQSMYTSITVGAPGANGYNISYVNGLSNTTYTVYKLLATDYLNYAFVCGYTNATDQNTAFAIVLTRNRNPNTTVLNNYEEMAFQQFANFTNGSMPLINQSPTCYAAGAYGLRELSFAATLLAVLYALVHFAM